MAKKGKVKISKLKRSNQVVTKLKKQGKIKLQRHKKKKKQNTQSVQNNNNNIIKQQYINNDNNDDDDNDSIGGSDMMEMMDNDDIQYILKDNIKVQQNKRKQISETADDALETEYHKNKGFQPDPKKKRRLLPIKTKQGLIIEQEIEEEDVNHLPEVLKTSKLSHEELFKSEASSENEKREISATQLLLLRHKEVQNNKFKIGLLCSGILENPELKIDNFFDLLHMLDDKTKQGVENILTVRKLAAVSILEVFKDILPDYQITQQDFEGVKLKKDTLALHKYENTLLAHYKRYLQRLEKITMAINKRKDNTEKVDDRKMKLGIIGINCLCDLLVSHPYFNYSSNIAQMLVPFLNSKHLEIRQTICQCFKIIFKNDTKGLVSLMLVRKINLLVKTRSHDVFCEVLDCLLALRIKDINLDREKNIESKQKKQMSHKQRLLSMSKKERKRGKKLKELEKEMLETKAEENKQSKQQNLTEIVKSVFTIYFRILKRSPNSKLLSATLEGISKFAHVINLEYYSDLVNLLNSLLKDTDLGYREQLHCVDTVFTILSGQGEFLNIDPSRFYSHLYSNLLTIHCGKNHQDFIIILKAVTSVLIKRRKKVSSQILLSYVKRLATCSTQLMHNGTLASLGIIKSVIQQSKMSEVILELDEELGSGKYNPYLMEPEYCNAVSTALYELIILLQHYHPTVKTMSQHIINCVPTSGEGSLPVEIGKLSPEELFQYYDGSQISFKPTIQPPKKVQPKTRPSKHVFTHPNFEEYCHSTANRTVDGSLDFYKYFGK